jgi:ribose transport system permease protein
MNTLASASTPARAALVRRNIGQFGVVFSVILLLIVFALVRADFPNVFFHPNNLANIARQVTLLMITSFAMTFIILSGEIDISIGAIASMCGVVIALLIQSGQPIPLALLAGVALGTLLGAINGFVIVRGKIPSFIVTLGTLNIVQGAALYLTKASTVTLPNNADTNAFRDLFARGTLFGIPHPLIIVVIVLLILLFLLTRTRFGSNVYAVGGNAASARLAGIPVNTVKIAVFTLAGLLVSIAAIVYTARLGNGQALGMIGYELDAIAAVVIGGTSFSGGRGSLWRTVIGALLVGVLNNALSLMGVSFVLQQVVSGVVIVLAVFIDQWTRRGAQS